MIVEFTRLEVFITGYEIMYEKGEMISKLIVLIFEAIIWSVLFKKTKKKDRKNKAAINRLLFFLDFAKILYHKNINLT